MTTSTSNKPRRFRKKQKMALYWLAGGKCSNCGKPLPDDWHGDHIKPWSKDGETEVANGQALCSDCNLKKGSRSQ